MKNKKLNRDDFARFFEAVVPFEGVEPAEDGLFDDCEICRDMRERLKSGEIARMHPERAWKYSKPFGERDTH